MTFTELQEKFNLDLDLLTSLNMKNSINKTLSIQQQKNCANAVLSMLHMVDPDCCILGGAPRDWALGNPAKDLDVYLQGYPNESRESISSRVSQALDLQKDEIEDVTKDSYYMHSLDNGVIGVLNVKNCFMPIQIVICDRLPIDMLDKFHGSLSKVSYCRSYNWNHLTNPDSFSLDTNLEFDVSKQFRVHLVKKSDDPKYIAKIQSKYPEYTVIYEA